MPFSKEHAVTGKLIFSEEEGLYLSIVGSFDTSADVSQFWNYQLILGVTSEGDYISLTNCQQTGAKTSSVGLQSEQFMVDAAYIGAHFNLPNEMKFHRCSVRFNYLDEWANLQGFNWQYKDDQPEWAVVSYTFPEVVRGQADGIDVSVRCKFSTSGKNRFEQVLRQTVWLNIETDVDKSFNACLKSFVSPFQNLLSLAVGDPNSVTDVVVYCKEKTYKNPPDQEIPIRVIYPKYFNEEMSKKIYAPQMLFTLQDIADNFSEVVKKWLEITNKFDSVCDLYFGVQYAPKMYLEQKFLSVVQAAETYHRRSDRFKNEYFSTHHYDELIRTIINCTPEEQRNWVRTRLTNTPSFKERVIELLKFTEVLMKPLICDEESFSNLLRDLRNYYTHYGSSGPRRELDNEELFKITNKIYVLLQTCFLIEIGFTIDKCDEMLKKNRFSMYQWLIDNQ